MLIVSAGRSPPFVLLVDVAAKKASSGKPLPTFRAFVRSLISIFPRTRLGDGHITALSTGHGALPEHWAEVCGDWFKVVKLTIS